MFTVATEELSGVETFKSNRAALEFLAGKIAAEAELAGDPLSEIERKMLFFSETAWSLPDILEVCDEFDRSYNQDEYEAKISGLIQSYLQRVQTKNQEGLEDWSNAVEKLSEEDYYIQVMLNATPPHRGGIWRWLPASSASQQREPGDRWRLVIVAFAVFFMMLLLQMLRRRLFGHDGR